MLNLNLFGQFKIKLKDFQLEERTVSTDPESGDPLIFTVKTYSTIVSINNQKTTISFDPDDIEEQGINLDTLCKFINKQVNWIIKNETTIKSKIIEDLFSLANEWNTDDSIPLTKELFKTQLKLNYLDFFSLESCFIDYHVGEIFAGHGVNINLSSDKKLDEAQMG